MSLEKVEVPITGKIISIDIAIGDSIHEGDIVCILESMKMENPIESPVDGKVTEVNVKVNQVVKPGDVIAVIEY